MDPEDDPLLLHVEVLDGDLDADGDGVKDKISQEDFAANARFLINKVRGVAFTLRHEFGCVCVCVFGFS
jgi:hypothetical protein